MAKRAADSGRRELRFAVNRSFARTAIKPVNFEKQNIEETGDEWYRWFIDVQNVLIQTQILAGRPSHHRGRIVEDSVEFELREREYREAAERDGQDGDTFVIARVLTAVSHSADFKDVNLVYLAVRGFLWRQLAAHDGPFDDVPVEVGDACYHLGDKNFGFVRGNVVVEIHVTPGWREDGKIRVGSPDTKWREKIVEAAKRIDAMLMEKMFTEEVRTRIRAAENKRTPGRHPVDSPRSRDDLNPESRRER